MQVHGAVENVWFGVCQSMQFALNIFDHVVILCFNFKLQIPIRVAAIGSADISLHVLETCTPDSILKVRPLCVYRRSAGWDVQQEASILTAISRDPNPNACHKAFSVQVYGNCAHTLVLVILNYRDSRIVACESWCLDWSSLNSLPVGTQEFRETKSASRPIKRVIRCLLKNMFADGSWGLKRCYGGCIVGNFSWFCFRPLESKEVELLENANTNLVVLRWIYSSSVLYIYLCFLYSILSW